MSASSQPGNALREAGIAPIPPGVFLVEHILPQRRMNIAQAAQAMDVPIELLSGVLTRQTLIDDDLAKRLGKFSGLSAEFWLNMQKASR